MTRFFLTILVLVYFLLLCSLSPAHNIAVLVEDSSDVIRAKQQATTMKRRLTEMGREGGADVSMVVALQVEQR